MFVSLLQDPELMASIYRMTAPALTHLIRRIRANLSWLNNARPETN
jgi:hypothetical protein